MYLCKLRNISYNTRLGVKKWKTLEKNKGNMFTIQLFEKSCDIYKGIIDRVLGINYNIPSQWNRQKYLRKYWIISSFAREYEWIIRHNILWWIMQLDKALWYIDIINYNSTTSGSKIIDRNSYLSHQNIITYYTFREIILLVFFQNFVLIFILQFYHDDNILLNDP